MKATTAKPPKSSMRVKKRTEWITVVASTRNGRRTQTGTLRPCRPPLIEIVTWFSDGGNSSRVCDFGVNPGDGNGQQNAPCACIQHRVDLCTQSWPQTRKLSKRCHFLKEQEGKRALSQSGSARVFCSSRSC